MSRGRFFEGFIVGIIATILGLFIADYYADAHTHEDDAHEEEDEHDEVESKVSKTLNAIEDKFDKLSEFVEHKRAK